MIDKKLFKYKEYWDYEYELAKLADGYQVSIDQMLEEAHELLTVEEYDYVCTILQRQSEILDLTHPHLKNVYLLHSK